MNREEIEKLRERVRGLSGADHDVDVALLAAFQGLRELDGFYEMGNWYYSALPEGDEKNPPLPSPTGSIDAALALVERVLPDHEWEVHRYWCELWQEDFSAGSVTGHAKTAPLAILDAVLTALLSGSEA